MTTLLALLAKWAIMSKLKKIVSFIIAHWRVILCVATLWYCYHLYNQQAERADKAETALKDYVAAQTELANAQTLKNQEQALLAASKVELAEAIAEQTQKRLGLEKIHRQAMANKLRKSTNEINILKTHLSNTEYFVNQRLQLQQPDGGESGLSYESSIADRLTQCERERDTIIDRVVDLEEACKLTTIDFNLCRATLDADTLACGRK
jgi:exonuclease VII large subunit